MPYEYPDEPPPTIESMQKDIKHVKIGKKEAIKVHWKSDGTTYIKEKGKKLITKKGQNKKGEDSDFEFPE